MGYSFDADYAFASGGDSEVQGRQMNNIVANSVSLPSVFLDAGDAEEDISDNVGAKDVRKPEDTNQASAANASVVTGGEEGYADPPIAFESIMNPASDGTGGTPSAPHGLLSAARASAGGERAAGCAWLADNSLLGPVWERVKALLPQRLGGGDLAGLNARWRLYRYDQGTGKRGDKLVFGGIVEAVQIHSGDG